MEVFYFNHLISIMERIDFSDENALYKVVINYEEMYSILPANIVDNPLGWKDTGFTGNKEACMYHIKELWTEQRPKSLRDAMKRMTEEE
jgi:MbtH protein